MAMLKLGAVVRAFKKRSIKFHKGEYERAPRSPWAPSTEPPPFKVWHIPVKQIQRTEASYKQMRDPFIYSQLVTDRVNKYRAVVRAGKEGQFPPIEVVPLNPPFISGKRYQLWNGHHRLTAHQAEGKTHIRAVIYGANGKYS
jgi:hypothetical protein